MTEKIVSKASELFLKCGFKSVSMDDIAAELCVSKKTIYKYFSSKDVLVADCSRSINKEVFNNIQAIRAKNFNAIEENFEIVKMIKEMFKASTSSHMYELKKHYPALYNEFAAEEELACKELFISNMERGIQQGLYRPNFSIQNYSMFYYLLIFCINSNVVNEQELINVELEALEYHTRAIVTASGLIELEKQLELIKE